MWTDLSIKSSGPYLHVFICMQVTAPALCIYYMCVFEVIHTKTEVTETMQDMLFLCLLLMTKFFFFFFTLTYK